MSLTKCNSTTPRYCDSFSSNTKISATVKNTTQARHESFASATRCSCGSECLQNQWKEAKWRNWNSKLWSRPWGGQGCNFRWDNKAGEGWVPTRNIFLLTMEEKLWLLAKEGFFERRRRWGFVYLEGMLWTMQEDRWILEITPIKVEFQKQNFNPPNYA